MKRNNFLPIPIVVSIVFLVSLSILVLPIASNIKAATLSTSQSQQDAQTACIDAERRATSDVSGSTWFIIGCLAGVLGWVIALVSEPSPPATALLGKSPEYVASYTDCYKRKNKDIKTKKALTGCLVGTGCIVALYVGLIAVAIDDGNF